MLSVLSPDRFVDSAANMVATGFRRMVSGDPDGQPDWVTQLEHGDDAGYFGAGSATWAVHGALPTLVGGVRALLMQAAAVRKASLPMMSAAWRPCSSVRSRPNRSS